VYKRLPPDYDEEWEQWGSWEYHDKYGRPRNYIPFQTLAEAIATIEDEQS
jgi:hypothetical protein